MLLKSLELINFRNYNKFKLDFSDITVLVGYNGIGKSNILEAISMLSYAKSYRARNERNLINWGNNYAQIKAVLEDDKKINFVVSKFEEKIKKEVKINDIPERLSNLIGTTKIVLFTPDSLRIITDSPRERRKFIDICLAQVDKSYLNNLIKFKKIIRQRNELLRHISFKKAKEKELDFWDREFADLTRSIIKKRLEFVKSIKNDLTRFYQEISSKNDKISINYESKFGDLENIKDVICAFKEREIDAGKTLFGPHLDDLNIFINGKNVSETGSRGEIRSLTLALKFSEIKFLKDKSKNKEILLLLDDIFSELDRSRRAQVVKAIRENQTVITTTDLEFVKISSPNNGKKIKIINLENGKNK